jgi:SAM-dependent methyltransferase
MHPFADHFSPLAPAYAAARPSYPDALLDYCAALAPARAHAWDCAAGSGQATVALATRFGRVTATDASEAQLAQAPPLPNVTYQVARAEASGLPAASTQLVVVAQALHWLDVAAFFAEVRRVLVPGGIVAVWCYGLQSLNDERVDRVLRHFYTDIVGPYWPPERRLVESGYRTVPFPFEELAAPPFEMSVHWSMGALLAYLRTWSATARYVREHGHDPVEPLAEVLAAVWGPPQSPRAVRWPLSVRVGRVASPV